MICKNCGAQTPDGSSFCTECGVPLEKNNSPDYSQIEKNQTTLSHDYSSGEFAVNMMTFKEFEKKSEIAKLDNAIEYFSKREQEYDEYDDALRNYFEYSKGFARAPLIIGIILAALSSTFLPPVVMALFGAILGGIIDSSSNTHSYYLTMILLYFIFVVLLATPLIIGLVLIIKYVRKRKKRSTNFASYEEQCNYLYDSLYNDYKAYENCPIGFEYSNPKNITIIRDTIVSGRANNIGDALNICLNDAKKSKKFILWKRFKKAKEEKGYPINMILFGSSFIN